MRPLGFFTKAYRFLRAAEHTDADRNAAYKCTDAGSHRAALYPSSSSTVQGEYQDPTVAMYDGYTDGTDLAEGDRLEGADGSVFEVQSVVRYRGLIQFTARRVDG